MRAGTQGKGLRFKRQWERSRGTGSDSFVERIFVDVEGKGRSGTMYIVWPGGESVSVGDRPHAGAQTQFKSGATGYTTTVRLPWKLLGRRPARGEVWGFNVTSAPAIVRNRQFTWAPQYDAPSGNPLLFGKMRFE